MLTTLVMTDIEDSTSMQDARAAPHARRPGQLLLDRGDAARAGPVVEPGLAAARGLGTSAVAGELELLLGRAGPARAEAL